MENMNEILYSEFIDYLQAEKNVTEYTVTSYWGDYKSLMTYIDVTGQQNDLIALTSKDLRLYIKYLKVSKKYHSNTVRRKTHTLSSFYKYLHEMEYIDNNPMLPIHAPKYQQKLPVFLTEQELKKLIEAPGRFARFPEHRLRDKVMIELLVYTGMRKSEARGLKWSDINFETKSILVNGKGRKQRVVPLLDDLGADLFQLFCERKPPSEEPIMISDSGRQMSNGGMQTLFYRYLCKLGYDKKGYTIHKLRHTYATLLYQQGVDILVIQQLLGHADLNTTKIYTHVTSRDLLSGAQKFPQILK